MREADSEADAVEQLHASGCTDGMPVIVPTPDRVQFMIARVDLDPDMVVGVMGPRQGAASIEKIATAAVMAGCVPDNFPVVLAAIHAVCDPSFDLTEVNQTTHCLAPLILVNGPARHECGPIECSFGILGPGNRASACIGRAMSLALINIAGRHPGSTDMAVYSSPGKFTACFAEDEAASPFAPYHLGQGFLPEDSTVTVIGVEGPHSVILEPTRDVKKDAERLLRCIAGTIANPGSNHIYRAGDGGMLVVINPEHAQILARAGYDRKTIQQKVRDLAVMKAEEAQMYYAGMNFVHEDDQDILHAVRNPDQIMLVVAGGKGSYSMVMPSWAYAPHGNVPVTRKIEVTPSCPLP
jgi:hypothetical protein